MSLEQEGIPIIATLNPFADESEVMIPLEPVESTIGETYGPTSRSPMPSELLTFEPIPTMEVPFTVTSVHN